MAYDPRRATLPSAGTWEPVPDSATRVRVGVGSGDDWRLVDCLRAGAASIREDWRRRVIEDASAPGEPLSQLELEEFVPEFVARIIVEVEELASGASPARQHPRLRTREGYDLSQVLRELRHLRDAIVETCERARVTVSGDGGRVVHGAIDAAMCAAALGC